MNTSNTELDVRELTIDETDAVSDGFLPLAIMAFAIGDYSSTFRRDC
jgi:hypothetical protein